MLSISVGHLRLFLHIAAAAVWVGGQLTLVGLLPSLRKISDEAPGMAGRAFARVAWPAFAVLIATGVWSLFSIGFDSQPASYYVTLFVKLVLVALSGVGAAMHTLATQRTTRAGWGALGLATALVALLLGVVLRG